MQLDQLDTAASLSVSLSVCYGVFTMRNTENETDNEGIGFYNNVGKCFHCPYSETNENLHCVLWTFIGIIYVSVSVSGSIIL